MSKTDELEGNALEAVSVWLTEGDLEEFDIRCRMLNARTKLLRLWKEHGQQCHPSILADAAARLRHDQF
jgi:hypothetical protein